MCRWSGVSSRRTPVALSGTLDTFALPDVLRLLATTGKSGRLRISGNRGSGSVWVVDGEVVSSELSSINSLDPSAVDVVFGLLRFDAGSFTFEADAVAPEAGPGMAMDPILSSAEHMLADWQTIEAVVPSLDVWVGLLPELDGPDVMVDALRWRCIATVGAGVQVGLIAEALELNEVEACRLVKELIELGLFALIDAPMELAPEEPAAPAPMTAPVSVDHEWPDDPPIEDVASFSPEPTEPAGFDSADLGPSTVPNLASLSSSHDEATEPVAPDVAEFGASAFDANANEPAPVEPAPVEPASVEPASFEAAAFAPLSPESNEIEPSPFGSTEPEPVEDLNPAEMARQLANLSPKAAKAVAAAAKANTEAEREAALAAVEAEDGSVNRGLLLKFLGSVDS